MKIMYYAHSLLSRGGDKMVLAHAGWLASQGHDVELCCNVVNTVFEIPKNVRIGRPLLPGIVGTVLSTLLQRRDVDVVLASIIPMACFLFPLNCKKVVYFAQDYDESYYSSPLLKRVVRIFYFTGLRLFRIPTIAVSQSLANLLTKYFHVPISVVENGVNTEVFYFNQSPELLDVKDGRKALLMLSRGDRRKGFDIAQNVVERLLQSHLNNFEIWTVGETCEGVFPGLIHRDFGYVDENTLRSIMSSADVFLYPTRHEGFGLMVAEAFACNCPVVTTKAVPFAIDLDNSMVCNVGDIDELVDKLYRLLYDDELRSIVVAGGRRFVAENSLQAATENFAKIISNMA